ncbi:MAG: hydroxymethylglutaryl-CoA lyase, partial [Cellvibrionales bacterium TMED49]
MATNITITDVGPRDGLQNLARVLSVVERASLINSLIKAGVSSIEIGSFVSPRAVPAMKDTDSLFNLLEVNDNVDYFALVPNLKGYQLAQSIGIKNVVLVVYASNSMSNSNVGITMKEAEASAIKIIKQAIIDRIKITATISVAFGCPFEGNIDPAVSVDLIDKLSDAGADRLVLADTIGAANPRQVSSLMNRLTEKSDPQFLGCHFHDTRAMGLANVYAALESGIRYFDTSIAGLGGCPFAPGSSGNVATEDVVMMLDQMGYCTGINLSELLSA